jgi:dihydroflavonol-4-reductase
MDLYRRKLPALVQGGYNWCDVRDVVEGALAAEQRGRRGERYLLAGHPLSLKELALAIEKVTGSRAPRMVTPHWVAQLVAPGAEMWSRFRRQRPKFTRHSVQIVGSNYQFVLDKARRELGYSPRPIDATLADTFAWYRSAGYL